MWLSDGNTEIYIALEQVIDVRNRFNKQFWVTLSSKESYPLTEEQYNQLLRYLEDKNLFYTYMLDFIYEKKSGAVV